MPPPSSAHPVVDLQGKAGSGAFQWNRGGWFGSQLGATLWLVILGLVLLAQSRPIGALVAIFGLLPNLIGLVLWRRRHAVAPYPALQGLLAACGVSALSAMLCIRVGSGAEAVAELPSIWLLLIYPGLMLVFHLQERRTRKDAVQRQAR